MLGELEDVTDAETGETSPMPPEKIAQAVIKSCFEGPYHSTFLANLTAIEDWYGRFWILKRRPNQDEEQKIAEKLSRSLVDGRALLESWRETDWERKNILTGQYL